MAWLSKQLKDLTLEIRLYIWSEALPLLLVMDGLQCRHCPTRFQLLESEAAYQYRRVHGSLAGCSSRSDLVMARKWTVLSG